MATADTVTLSLHSDYFEKGSFADRDSLTVYLRLPRYIMVSTEVVIHMTQTNKYCSSVLPLPLLEQVVRKYIWIVCAASVIYMCILKLIPTYNPADDPILDCQTLAASLHLSALHDLSPGWQFVTRDCLVTR